MAFRKCSRHGWMATTEYTVSTSGETICPTCALDDDVDGCIMRDFTMTPPNGVLADAQYGAREKFEQDRERVDRLRDEGVLADGVLNWG